MTEISHPVTAAEPSGPAASRSETGLGPGTKIGRYLILERVGAGGMGVVFSAYDPQLDRRVAIKLLASDLLGEESRVRLLREAQAMARLSHPNVVPVYDAGSVDGRVFVAMEFVQGVTLREWLDGEARGWTDVLETMRRAALGLQAAHQAGLVHRDFKPDNVMVGDDGRVRVLDFGLARSAALYSEPEALEGTAETHESTGDGGSGEKALAVRVTSQGAMLGTPAYMPPEQLEGREVDARTDQWSFCVTLYEGLYGSRPFEGATVAAFVLAMHDDGLRPPPDSSPVPGSVFAAVARGLELEPNARHPSIGALLEALELSPPSRSRAIPVALVGFGAVIAGTSWWSAQKSDAACESRAAAAPRVWSAQAQQAGAAAFERSTVGYQSEAWTRSSGRITDYVAAWSREAGRACRSSRADTAEIDALRTRCLDGHLRRLKSVVDAFANANDEVVHGAVQTAFQLPELEQCADLSSLLAPVRPPNDPAKQAELARLEVELEAAASHRISADYAEGRKLARVVVDEARELAYEPFTAAALNMLASFEQSLGEHEAARDGRIEAFELAASAHDDRVAAYAAMELASIFGSDLRSPVAAEAWTTVAATMVTRAGQDQRSPEAELRSIVGSVAATQKDYERALTEFSAARDIWEALPGEHPLQMANVFHNTGGVLFELGRYDESRDLQLRALQIHEETLEPNHPNVASSLGQLSILALSRGELAVARDYEERALAIKRAALPPGHTDIATSQMHLGMILVWSGEFEGAIENLEHALELDTEARGAEHPEVARAMHNLAMAYVLQGGRDDEAEALYRRELAIRRKTLRAGHPALAPTLRDLGELMVVQGDPEEALRLIEEAVAINTEASGPDHPKMGLYWFSLSRAHDANGNAKEALDAAGKAVAVAERSGASELDLARTRVQLGQLRWRLGEDRAQARRLVEQAAAMMAKNPDLASGEQAEVRVWLEDHPRPD